MLGLSHRGPQPAKMLAIALTALLSSPLGVQGLRTTSGSPYSQYDQTKGRDFEDCIKCELESTYVDRLSGESDVNWGLYNLRFAFTTCVFGYPAVVTNQTSQCPVACAGIEPAVEINLLDPTADNFQDWCKSTAFADNIINTCEFCYNLTSEAVNPGTTGGQVYLANFLESIRYNCHYSATIGSPFDISPSRIFTEVLLPSSMSLSTATASSGGVNLGLVIALPVLGFIIILIVLATCCFFFIRYRRKRVRRNRYQSHLYERWNNPASGSPHNQGGWGWAGQPAYSDHDQAAGAAAYGHGLGFGFVDNDGHAREVGYGYDHSQAKTGFQHGISEAPLPETWQPEINVYGEARHGYPPDQKHAL
ncbi:uncharacterized protein N7477_001777 [Penicillium maclennaniae]|uniref:uncharacterized protein n=1 Tax=Penicillium maclennaniae TaxID=1343394 RepID=UPI00253FC215|nr:uncharacterized protein N7477_001777 [Penicillium maclennaniae]KAJ5681837.1 hypothetical protein N7477_001777 [Penicillium maclennaniae]